MPTRLVPTLFAAKANATTAYIIEMLTRGCDEASAGPSRGDSETKNNSIS